MGRNFGKERAEIWEGISEFPKISEKKCNFPQLTRQEGRAAYFLAELPKISMKNKITAFVKERRLYVCLHGAVTILSGRSVMGGFRLATLVPTHSSQMRKYKDEGEDWGEDMQHFSFESLYKCSAETCNMHNLSCSYQY